MARVTIISVPIHLGWKRVSIGDTVVLIKDPNHPKDPFAIRVLTEDEQDQVGWVSNSAHTVSQGTLSATEVNPLIKDKVKGTIVDETVVTFANGRESKAFIVEVKLVQDKGEVAMSKVNNFVVKIIGSKSAYPSRFERVIPDFKNGEQPFVELVVKGDQVIAEYKGEPCGYLSKAEEKGLTPYDDVIASISESKIAKITNVIGTKVIAEFTVDEAEFANQKARKTLNTVIQDIVSNGIDTQENIDEKLDYLRNNHVTERQILSIFETYKKYDDEVAKLIPDKPKTLYQDEGTIIKRSIGYVNMRRNLLLEGDRGVGKNVMIETLAWIYNRPLYEFSLNSQHDNTSIFGSKTINTDENGNTVMGFEPEVIVQAGENGGILVLDEFNTSFGHVMSVLNASLDDRRRFNVPGYKTFIADENFVAIATMNKDYQSTFELNEATQDRFVPIVFPKPRSIMNTLIAKIPNLEYRVAQICDTLYKGILKCVEDGEISERALTVRGFIDACLGTEQDIPLKDTLIDNVSNRCSDVDDRESIRNMIEDILG